MTRSTRRRTALAVVPLTFLAVGCSVAQGHEPAASQSAAAQSAGHDHGDQEQKSQPPATVQGKPVKDGVSAAGRPGSVAVKGDPVPNIRQNADDQGRNFCDSSDLPPGEGKADKANTCVSTPLGEIAEHPVRVTANTSPLHLASKPVKIKILVADNQGIMDLNAFTFDAGGGAGVTLHERPGELDARGRPLMHCHLGVVSVARAGALPGEDYNAAFSGVQGVKGDLTATVTGLPRGSYRADVFCSVPGHPILPTNIATRVQAFDTTDFRVIGRK